MKKIIFIISITLLAFNSQAQGTLQFNQVLTFTQDTSFGVNGANIVSNYPTMALYTVPPNRVVKITKAINQLESVSVSGGCSENVLYFTINEINTINLLEGAWLKAGDIIGFRPLLSTGNQAYHACYQYDNIFLSLIEYNIIP
jgi:hypothetical protein